MVAPIVNMPNTVKHNGISGIPTQLLVLHSAECPLRGGYAQSLTSWANVPLEQGGPVASWQRFVDPIARVRMVPDQYAAWHASEANPMSIGWEQAGYAAFSRAQWETPEGLKQLDNLAYDMAEVAKRDGIPPVWLTTDQVEAVTHRGNRSIKGFCIHAQIDPDIRTDPGSNYPYDRLMDRIKHYLGDTGGAATGPTPSKESELSRAEVDEIKNHISAILTRQWHPGDNQMHPGVALVVEENQRRIGDVPRGVSHGVTVSRGGKKIPWVQDTADTNTMVRELRGTVAALTELVGQLSNGQDIDYERIKQGTREVLAQETVTVDVTVNEKEPA